MYLQLLTDLIAINPTICKPCIRNLHDPVEFVLELLIAGMTNEENLAYLHPCNLNLSLTVNSSIISGRNNSACQLSN